ncbi:MAG: FHA domain-containing protein, partial [Erysipelotrichaceae bacterium]|nr:FHA domain-containing protein [Erysipelotrichaceae bacterium]
MEENMQITLLKGQQLEEIHLSFKHVGDYIIKDYNHEHLLKIFQKEHMWYAQTLADVFLSVGLHKYRYCLLEPQTIYSLDTLQGDKILFIFENHKRDTFIFQKLQMKVKSICIGRSHHCDLCYEHPFVSYKHAKLSFTYGNWYIEDLNSTNGTFVNQRKIKKSLLAFGDIIDIMGLKIIIAKQCFICNRIQEIYLSPTIAKYIPYDFLNPTYIRDKSFYSPSLRMSAFPCCQEYTIEAPPLQVSEQRKLSLLYILGPSLTMGFPSFYNLFLQMMEVQKGNKSIKDIFSSFVVAISRLMSIFIGLL